MFAEKIGDCLQTDETPTVSLSQTLNYAIARNLFLTSLRPLFIDMEVISFITPLSFLCMCLGHGVSTVIPRIEGVSFLKHHPVVVLDAI